MAAMPLIPRPMIVSSLLRPPCTPLLQSSIHPTRYIPHCESNILTFHLSIHCLIRRRPPGGPQPRTPLCSEPVHALSRPQHPCAPREGRAPQSAPRKVAYHTQRRDGRRGRRGLLRESVGRRGAVVCEEIQARCTGAVQPTWFLLIRCSPPSPPSSSSIIILSTPPSSTLSSSIIILSTPP